MGPALLVFILYLFRFSFSFKISFDPVELKLTENPKTIVGLMESFIKGDQFQLLAVLLATEDADFVTNYCELYEKPDNSFLIYHIIYHKTSKKISLNVFKKLLEPKCISKSLHVMANLTDNLIEILPLSLLESSNVPTYLLPPPILELVLRRAEELPTFKMNWFDWCINLDLAVSCTSQFYFESAWKFIDFEAFETFTQSSREVALKWLFLDGGSAKKFSKLSSDEILMRTLTFISWDPPTPTSATTLTKKVYSRLTSDEAMRLSCKLISLQYPDHSSSCAWPLSTLLEIISALGENRHADWFIGILHIWKSTLKVIETVDKIEPIVHYVLFSLRGLTQNGIRRFAKLFHFSTTIRHYIESKVIERLASKNDLYTFYLNHWDFFRFEFGVIPLSFRISTFLRGKRITKSDENDLLLKAKFDMSLYKSRGPEIFLFHLSEVMRRGIKDLSNVSINPPQISFFLYGMYLSFNNLVCIFLRAFADMAHLGWTRSVKNSQELILRPNCPQLFWELLGYFIIQGRILRIPQPFKLDRIFFLEVMKTQPRNQEYLSEISIPFESSTQFEYTLLSHSLNSKFTVASVFPDAISVPTENLTNQSYNCKALAVQLYEKFMDSMRDGFIHVLESANRFTPEELYSFIYEIKDEIK